MSERKVLNKYIPPNFDPSKIPKAQRSKQWTVRMMLPWNVQCASCGEYLPRGRKFNTRMEPVEGENYLSIKIWRFYFRCNRCAHEFTLKTDPKNTDYVCEMNCRRTFELWKTPEGEEIPEKVVDEEEEGLDTMALLEKRTKESLKETQILEALEQTRFLNAKANRMDLDKVLEELYAQQQAGADEDLDAEAHDVMSQFSIKRLPDDVKPLPKAVENGSSTKPAPNDLNSVVVVTKKKRRIDNDDDTAVEAKPKTNDTTAQPEPSKPENNVVSLVDVDDDSAGGPLGLVDY